MKKQMCSVKEAAIALDVCEATIRRRINDGKIPSKRYGRTIKIPLSFIESEVKNPISNVQRFIFG